MLLSMTGFGRAIEETRAKKFTVEIKSLNSKQFDVAVRIPGNLRELELDVRNRAAQKMLRGKADLSISVESNGADDQYALNLPRVKSLVAQLRNASKELGLPEPADWFQSIIRMPDVFRNDNVSDLPDEDKEALMAALDGAIASLMDFRREEGKKLESFFTQRIANISELLAQVPKFEEERIVKIRARMEDALSKLPQADYDRGRYEQEMIFYIEKLDVTEEKQRLTQHLKYFLETMDEPFGQGKKLGFIAQEMGREINTLGSKSNHAEMQILVVKMKDELEQIKEQVLNVL